MTAHNTFTAAPASWVETHPGHFTVTHAGETRAISKDGTEFIAWIGHQSRQWCFARALKACVEDIEYRQFEAIEAARAHEEAIASLMRMTPAAKARLIASLEAERDGLDYADSEMDIVARKARIERRIANLREFA